MNILAIETSCDETAVAIVKNGRTALSNTIVSQIEEHALYGGVVPEIASRRHAESISQVTTLSLNQASMKISDIDGIAVTHAPGLIGALLVGVNFAKGLSMSTDLPLIPVHHLRSHIAANYIDTELTPPFMALVVSGGHTHIVKVKEYTEFKVIGQTRDDAVGECFDKVARTIGLPYPGGVHIDKRAANGKSNTYKLPTPKIENNKYDFSFSGLKTSVINLVHTAKQRGDTINIDNLCASFQTTAVNMLINNVFKALDDYEMNTLVLAGGVSANSQLRAEMKKQCDLREVKFHVPPLEYCTDNAAMVGAQGYYEYCNNNNIAGLGLNASASMSIE